MPNVVDQEPITSAHDYAVVLSRIDQLMDAEPGKAEGRELDLLADLVEAYEDEPMGRPDPVPAIEFGLEQTASRA